MRVDSQIPHGVDSRSNPHSLRQFTDPQCVNVGCRNPKKHRHLQDLFGSLSLGHARRQLVVTSASRQRTAGGSERDIGGGSRRNQGLRLPTIPVITPIQADEASRVLHPPRFGASGCSAKGRSATRSDSQRSHGRTRWDGHPAWGSIPRLHLAPPIGKAAGGGRWEENGGASPDLGLSMCETAA